MIDRPVHPYTRALIAAVCEPVAGKVNKAKIVPIKGDPLCREHTAGLQVPSEVSLRG